MATLTVRKNFNFEKDLLDKANKIIQQKNKNFTQVLTSYFKAITKDPSLIDVVEEKAKKRTGKFIGILDNVIGEQDYKDMRKAASVE